MSEKIVYRIDFSDYLAMYSVMKRKGRYYLLREAFFWLLVVINLTLPVFYGSLLGFQVIMDKFVSLALPHLAIGLGLLFWRYVMVRWIQYYYYQRQELGSNDIMLEVSQAGLNVKLPSTRTTHEWSAIKEIDFTASHLFLWINKVQAYIVPLRIFSSDQQKNAFCAHLPFPQPK